MENDEEIIRRGELHLEKLLLNLLSSERVFVVNDENTLTFTGTELEVRTKRPGWLNMLVTKIAFNKDAGMIQINVTNS